MESKAQPLDSEFEAIDLERQEIEKLLHANCLALERYPSSPTFMLRLNSGMMRVQTLRVSPERQQLLDQQWRLIQRRNEIYGRWAALRMERIEKT